jgi:hypothetical protein
MTAQVIPIRSSLETAWAEYLAARDRAERSRDIADGIACGRAFRRWLEIFLTDDQRRAIGGGQ